MQNTTSSLKPITHKSFPGLNSLQFSLVEETNPKDQYVDKFFMFIKFTPGIKSDTSPTGRSYDIKNSIAMVLRTNSAYALSFALKLYAEGKGKPFEDRFGPFKLHADASKSSHGGSQKTISLTYYPNSKTGKETITLGGFSGNVKVPIYLTPYEAYGVARTVEELANLCMKMEASGPGIIVKNTGGNGSSYSNGSSNSSGNNFTGTPNAPTGPVFTPQPQMQQQSYQMQQPTQTQQNQQSINQVSSGFEDAFGSFGDY